MHVSEMFKAETWSQSSFIFGWRWPLSLRFRNCRTKWLFTKHYCRYSDHCTTEARGKLPEVSEAIRFFTIVI